MSRIFDPKICRYFSFIMKLFRIGIDSMNPVSFLSCYSLFSHLANVFLQSYEFLVGVRFWCTLEFCMMTKDYDNFPKNPMINIEFQ